MGRRQRLRLPVDHPDYHHPLLLLRRKLGRQWLRLQLRLQQQLRVQRRLLLIGTVHGAGRNFGFRPARRFYEGRPRRRRGRCSSGLRPGLPGPYYLILSQ